jgi:hypothetical protein
MPGTDGPVAAHLGLDERERIARRGDLLCGLAGLRISVVCGPQDEDLARPAADEAVARKVSPPSTDSSR